MQVKAGLDGITHNNDVCFITVQVVLRNMEREKYAVVIHEELNKLGKRIQAVQGQMGFFGKRHKKGFR